jgi:glycosyltransferase involved in cell wall biosynthesis
MRARPKHLTVRHQTADGAVPATKTRSWRVIHACEHARDVFPVVEGQVAAGMQPYIVTPCGSGSAEVYLASRQVEQSRPLSLIRSWQDVRGWRKSILECDPENTADLVHTHTFASGMAAVRSCTSVVYDFQDCIDEMAMATGQAGPGSWMGRSFRAAEQFILSRAGAVIVHSQGMKEAARERGAPLENVFLIADPLPTEEAGAASLLPPSHSGKSESGRQTTVFFAPRLTAAPNEKLPATALLILEAFAAAARELPGGRLLLEAAPGTGPSLLQRAAKIGLAGSVSLVPATGLEAAWQGAHVVIALGEPVSDPVTARRPNPVCLEALRQGAALLAADVPRNRDTSPDGRGCLWFEANNARDLGCRMVFLGANPGFRAALASTGRAYLLEARNSAAIGRKYHEAYLHAASRKKAKHTGSGVTIFYPAANCA